MGRPIKNLLFAIISMACLGNPEASRATSITFGFPGTGPNRFPFGNSSDIGDRYQQVYNENDFSGAMIIETITFYKYLGSDFRTGDYDFYLSTTSKSVNGLDTSNFDSNDGADNSLFLSVHLSGAAPDVINFSGTGFLYDPSKGNLLLDIHVANGINDSNNPLFCAARNGDFGDASSRAHDFGTMADSTGLVTTFSGEQVTIPDCGTTFTLLGIGAIGAIGLRRKE